MNVPHRRKFIVKKGLCFNCLGIHAGNNCANTRHCKKCGNRHHTTIYESFTVRQTPESSTSPNNHNTEVSFPLSAESSFQWRGISLTYHVSYKCYLHHQNFIFVSHLSNISRNLTMGDVNLYKCSSILVLNYRLLLRSLCNYLKYLGQMFRYHYFVLTAFIQDVLKVIHHHLWRN